MLGFELKFRDKIIYLPLDANPMISMRKIDQGEEIFISAGLYESETYNIVNWVNENLHLGDSVEITIKQIELISDPVEVFNYYERMNTTKEESDLRTLERFLLLKKELEEKGLI